jgi:mRNA interferase MazF
MPPSQPFRGEVWEVSLPRIGPHNVVIMSRNVPALSSVVGIVITHQNGPSVTHVPCGHDDGLTGYDVSYINVTDVHSIDKASLRRRRGLLHPTTLARAEYALHRYLAFDCEGPPEPS